MFLVQLVKVWLFRANTVAEEGGAVVQAGFRFEGCKGKLGLLLKHFIARVEIVVNIAAGDTAQLAIFRSLVRWLFIVTFQ